MDKLPECYRCQQPVTPQGRCGCKDGICLMHADCRDVLPLLEPGSVTAVVTDPPYGLEFMGKAWDHGVPGKPFWAAMLEVCKPGSPLLAFGGDRTHHRLMCAVEDAGWDIRTCIYWLFGSGFPKSLNIEKAVRSTLRKGAGYSSRTTEDSQSHCSDRSRQHDEPLPSDQVDGQDALPSQGDVPGYSRVDRRVDGQAVTRVHSDRPGAGSGPLSSEDLTGQSLRQSVECPGDDNAPSDKPVNTSSVSRTEPRRMEPHKSDNSGSAYDSVSSSSESPCDSGDMNIPHGHDEVNPSIWQGYGTALKPAAEIIVLAMKPLDGTFAANALEHGVAGLNVDGCRIGTEDVSSAAVRKPGCQKYGGQNHRPHHDGESTPTIHGGTSGRWPANVILSHRHECDGDCHSDCPVGMLGEQSGELTSRASGYNWMPSSQGEVPITRNIKSGVHFGDTGTAARFFYTAKASRAERGKGNVHPTVKPLDLMAYLCRLVSMPGHTGTLLDPFCGSGTTLLAASRWFERAIGIDSDEDSCRIAAERLGKEVLF